MTSDSTTVMRHAYLIIANDKFDLLGQLLGMLDDPRNDIFLLIDKKSRSVPLSSLRKCVKNSKLYIHPAPIPIYWGDYSQIEAELLLMDYATGISTYAYYHLLSGKCVPIKSRDYIHSFFEKHRGTQFVSIDNIDMNAIAFRYKYHFPILRRLKAPKSFVGRVCLGANIALQKLCGVNRVRNSDVMFKKGANWFSITHDAVLYVLSQKDWIKKTFQNTYCCDEVFLQTLLYCSEFRDKIYYNPYGEHNMRYTDWERGNPYTFQLTDVEELKQSTQLFARKIDDVYTANMVHRACTEKVAASEK